MNRFKSVILVCAVLFAGNACTMEGSHNHRDTVSTSAEGNRNVHIIRSNFGARSYQRVELMAANEVGAKLRPSIRMLVLAEDDIPYEAMNRLLSLNRGEISLEDFRNWIIGLNIDDQVRSEYIRTVDRGWWIKFDRCSDVLHIKKGIRRSNHAVLINSTADRFLSREFPFASELNRRFGVNSMLLQEVCPFPTETWSERRKARKFARKHEVSMEDIKEVRGWEDAENMTNWPKHNFDMEISLPNGYVHINQR